MMKSIQLFFSFLKVKSDEEKPNLKQHTRHIRQASEYKSPALQEIWCHLRCLWFPDRPDIDSYKVYWSRRPQKHTLASCNVRYKKVRVARELDNPKYSHWIEPLLYHEMCHAYLGEPKASKTGRRSWHGAEFKKYEAQHPKIEEFNKWVSSGGWRSAVRSDRARRAFSNR
jgi:hypothetical protein